MLSRRNFLGCAAAGAIFPAARLVPALMPVALAYGVGPSILLAGDSLQVSPWESNPGMSDRMRLAINAYVKHCAEAVGPTAHPRFSTAINFRGYPPRGD